MSGTQTVNVANQPSVHVVNTPTVNAVQQGSWSVGISALENTVKIANSGASPVFVRESLTTFQARLLRGETFIVPPDKALVIEFVSVEASGAFDGGDGFLQAAIGTSVAQLFARHELLVTSRRVQNSNLYTASQLTKIYADPGTTVQFITEFASTTGVAASLTLSGSLLDVLPQ